MAFAANNLNFLAFATSYLLQPNSLDERMVEDPEIKSAKRAMRRAYNATVAGFAGKSAASSAIVSNLQSSELYSSALMLVCFMPMECEPNIMPLMMHWLTVGRRLLLPVFDRDRKSYALAEVQGLDERYLTKGNYGILEPRDDIPRQQPPYTFSVPALWLVPGIAFTRTGLRLGRGGGYYDRLLEGASGVKIGVCFDCQLAESLPVTWQDATMDYILTESCITKCTSN